MCPRISAALVPKGVAMSLHEADSIVPFDVLYGTHHGWLNGWLRRSVGCSQQAADLAQDTFVRLLVRNQPVTNRSPRRPRWRASPAAW